MQYFPRERDSRLRLTTFRFFFVLLLLPATNSAQTITEYPISTPGSGPSSITAGPDGNLWFTEFNVSSIGRVTPAGVITEYSVPDSSGTESAGIVTGSDGNLWFTLADFDNGEAAAIGRITPAGAITQFPLPNPLSGPAGIAAGPDGNLWFTESNINGNAIGRITTAGVITEFPILTPGFPLDIAAGPDGSLWFTHYADRIGRITTSGVITEFAIPTVASVPTGITAGADGNLWFTEQAANKIGRVTVAGVITEFPIPTPASQPRDIIAGPDGNLWFTEEAADKIGRITTTGVITEFPVPTAASRPLGITAGPDGNLWFVEFRANKIGRVNMASLTPQPASVDAHAVAGTSSNVNGVLEPGETVEVSPAWKNTLAGSQSFSGAAASLTGPSGPTYAIDDATAGYGTVAGGATANCHDATGDCYGVTVSGARPTAHWDAVLTEDLSVASTRWARLIHIGYSFADVPTTHPFYAFIENLFHSGATGGCGGGNYCPSGTVTRAQMAVFLLKGKFGASHVPPPATGLVFTDVHVGDFAADWIEELAGLQITDGCGGGMYCPNNPVTRAQMAVFLLKSEHGPAYVPPACAGIFVDVPCPSPFADWIEKLAAEGITAGCGGGNYCPDDPNIRGQMAVFLVKVYGIELYGP